MPGSLLCELWPSECYVFRSPKCSDANHVLRCPYRTMRLHALLGGTWWNMVEPRISAVLRHRPHRIKTIKRLGMARPLDSLDCNGASLICPYLSCWAGDEECVSAPDLTPRMQLLHSSCPKQNLNLIPPHFLWASSHPMTQPMWQVTVHKLLEDEHALCKTLSPMQLHYCWARL